MEAALSAWHHLAKVSLDGRPLTQLPLPISSIPYIIPGLNVTQWLDLGISTVDDLQIGPTTQDFLIYTT